MRNCRAIMFVVASFGLMIGAATGVPSENSSIGLRRIDARSMSDIKGGACGTVCQNFCETTACGNCRQGQGNGENCVGSGGTSMGFAFVCVTGTATQDCQVGSANPSMCNTAYVCRCVNSTCTRINVNNSVNGDNVCATGVCPN